MPSPDMEESRYDMEKKTNVSVAAREITGISRRLSSWAVQRLVWPK